MSSLTSRVDDHTFVDRVFWEASSVDSAPSPRRSASGSFNGPCQVVSEVFRGERCCDLLKADVQGAELTVLLGGLKTLSQAGMMNICHLCGLKWLLFAPIN